jgi:hypothetical protein
MVGSQSMRRERDIPWMLLWALAVTIAFAALHSPSQPNQQQREAAHKDQRNDE